MKRTIFIISDGTGLTAQALAHSLLTQFPNFTFDYVTLPYIDSIEKANDVIKQINAVFESEKHYPIVFSTLVTPEIRKALENSSGILIDFFAPFMPTLEEAFQSAAKPSVGQMHGLTDYESYKTRIDAINYTLSCDDGVGQNHYDQADLILLGVSRSGKTPTCLYLAIEFGIFAANYPLTEEFFSHKNSHSLFESHRHKLFGLTINDQRLHQIRSERKKDSVYASLSYCQQELKKAFAFFKEENIPYLDTTLRSIEEIATSIISMTGIKIRGN